MKYFKNITTAEDVERLTKENRHGDAVLSELYTLCACGVNVRDIIDEVRGLNTSETLGREPAEAVRVPPICKDSGACRAER